MGTWSSRVISSQDTPGSDLIRQSCSMTIRALFTFRCGAVPAPLRERSSPLRRNIPARITGVRSKQRFPRKQFSAFPAAKTPVSRITCAQLAGCQGDDDQQGRDSHRLRSHAGCSGPSDTVYYAAEWTAENILKGPSERIIVSGVTAKQMAPGDFTDYFGLSGYTAEELSKQGYWVWTPPQRKGNFISEGDTPMFLNLSIMVFAPMRMILGEVGPVGWANFPTGRWRTAHRRFRNPGGKDEVLPDLCRPSRTVSPHG